MVTLTETQAAALADAAREELFRDARGRWQSLRAWRAYPPATVRRLIALGLASNVNGRLYATDEGRAWLAAQAVAA